MIYFFNSDNDLALASGSVIYTPSQSIEKMMEDLSPLLAWIANEGDSVYVPNICVAQATQQLRLFPKILCISTLNNMTDMLCPWGWSSSLVRKIHRLAPDFPLLSLETTEKLKMLSSRVTYVSLLATLSKIPNCIGESCVFDTFEGIENYLDEHTVIMMKSPWSGSGNGVRKADKFNFPDHRNWVKNVLQKQHVVLAEPFYHKVVDFAMEFYVDIKGKVSFAGYSLFRTDTNGRYKENWLTSDNRIEQHLSKYVSTEVLEQVKMTIVDCLKDKYTDVYAGYFGVDMMICDEAGKYYLHPCVELNLRMNMGILSRRLFDNYVCPNSEGSYQIEYYATPQLAKDEIHKLQQEFPLIIENNRVRSGYFPLTPLLETTQYHAFMKIKSCD